MLGLLLFFAVFCSVYGLMHLLVYNQAAALLNPRPGARWALRLWMLIMVLAPPAVSLLGGRAAWPGWLTFGWMGLVFYLFLGAIIVQFLRLIGLKPLARASFKLVIVISVVLSGWGFYQARQVEVREITIATDRLPAGVEEVVIAQLSDVHIYSVEAEDRLKRILEALSGREYDLLVSTGDLIEAGTHSESWGASAALLAALKPRLGKYAVVGNHEVYADQAARGDIAARFHNSAGFTLVRQEIARVGDVLDLVGIDDPARGNDRRKKLDLAETALLQGLDRDRPVVLLKHQPVVTPDSVGLFDLQLSGHTHSGQMWPFNYLVELRYPHLKGLYDLGRDSYLYVSPGSGTWGPPMRLVTTATVTLIRLKAD